MLRLNCVCHGVRRREGIFAVLFTLFFAPMGTRKRKRKNLRRKVGINPQFSRRNIKRTGARKYVTYHIYIRYLPSARLIMKPSVALVAVLSA